MRGRREGRDGREGGRERRSISRRNDVFID